MTKNPTVSGTVGGKPFSQTPVASEAVEAEEQIFDRTFQLVTIGKDGRIYMNTLDLVCPDGHFLPRIYTVMKDEYPEEQLLAVVEIPTGYAGYNSVVEPAKL